MALFTKRNEPQEMIGDKPRLPPGQTLTAKWPVLSYGSTPRYDMNKWTFRVFGEVEQEFTWTFQDILALPKTELVSDVHCVTHWSRYNNKWGGVHINEVMKHIKPKAGTMVVMAHADPGYTTNVPLENLIDADVLLAYEHDGRPLEPDHGGPLRLVVPKLYFWKSAKWLRGFQFLNMDAPGFWEMYGYHMRGDPWLEERYGTPEETNLMSRMRAEKTREERAAKQGK